MKKITLFMFLSIFAISCENNDNFENPTDGNNVQLKLKEVKGIRTSKYFYHENGYVDSISILGGGLVQVNVSQKFHYNSDNILTSLETLASFFNNNPNIYVKNIFEYNNQNQIIKKKEFDVNDVLKSETNYSYNQEGYLDNGQIYENGNVIQVSNINYNYDNKKNPFYEIFPVAYVRINNINKNNQISSSSENELLESTQWQYNQFNYPTLFQKTPIVLDDENNQIFIYYP